MTFMASAFSSFPEALSSPPPEGIALYIHWPFCSAKCPYCDFNSHVRHGGIDQKRYGAALIRELDHYAAQSAGRPLEGVFFGGGTPSLMHPDIVADILERIGMHWSLDPGVEVTLEANPASVDMARFRGYKEAGVNRLSLGVQSMRDDALRKLGRLHNVAEALRALELTRSLFDRFSFDLIYARPGQDLADWREELGIALKVAGDHLSLYQLTIEQGTPFYALHQAGRLLLPQEELGRDLFDLTQELCEEAGFFAYEISNHARSGGASRHNLVYWRYGEYIGIGAGAHGRLLMGEKRCATRNLSRPESWLCSVEEKGSGLEESGEITAEEAGMEYILMGLRLAEGIEPARYEALSGKSFPWEKLSPFLETGLMEKREESRIAATRQGRPILNHLLAAIVG